MSETAPSKKDGIGAWLEWQRLHKRKRSLPPSEFPSLSEDGIFRVKLVNSEKEALVSACDYDKVKRIRWRLKVSEGGYEYASGCIPGERGRTQLMHRFLMRVAPGLPVKVDHRDGNGLHNFRENLRLATNAENCRNSKLRSGKRSSRFKGVSKQKDGTYRAQIMCDRKKYNLGNHSTERMAAHAYDLAAIRLFGPFARLNRPYHKVSGPDPADWLRNATA